MRSKTAILILIGVALIALLTWRMLRPMNIFIVSDAFERPIPVTVLPDSRDESARRSVRRLPHGDLQ